MTKTVDEILEQIGQMGRFQISRLAIFCFLMFPPTFHVLNMYFLAAEAPWQCVKNSTECKLNGSFVVGDKNYDFRCTINRSEWEYADYEGPKDSIISQFDLVCDNAAYGWLATSMTNIGDALFTVPLGMISDRYGRLKTLYPCTAVMIVVAFASAFATEYWQFLLSRLLVGATTYGIYLPAFILCGEFVGPRYRPLSQTIIWFAFTGVLLVLVLIAYFVRTWRTLMIMCSAPWIFVLVFWKFTPESIRWYLTHDKIEKAQEKLVEIAKTNKKEYTEEPLKIPTSSSSKDLGCLALFATWPLFISNMVQASAWIINMLVYVGISYGATDLGGSMYLNFMLASVIEIPANVLVIDNCERFGRKKTVIGYMILGGVACLVVSGIPANTERTDHIVGRVISGILAKGFITVSFDSLFVWSGEIFPTVVRNSGMAFVGVLGRIGSVGSPFLVELNRVNPALPFGLMGGLIIIAAFFCFVLPETRRMPTSEVYETNYDTAQGIVLEDKASTPYSYALA